MELSMKFNNATVQDLIRARRVISRLQTNSYAILFPKLSGDVVIQAFSDASFANLIDGVSSGRGQIIFLADWENRAAPLTWTANKVKRVVSSTLAAEALSLHECINTSQYLRHVIGEALRVKPTNIPIIAHTDSNNLIKALHSTSLVSDQKLRIDIGAMKEIINEENVEVVWTPASKMLADCLTKKGADVKKIMAVLESGQIPIDKDDNLTK